MNIPISCGNDSYCWPPEHTDAVDLAIQAGYGEKIEKGWVTAFQRPPTVSLRAGWSARIGQLAIETRHTTPEAAHEALCDALRCRANNGDCQIVVLTGKWRATKTGGFSRLENSTRITVTLTRKGSWCVHLNKTLLKGYFASAEDAMAAGDRAVFR